MRCVWNASPGSMRDTATYLENASGQKSDYGKDENESAAAGCLMSQNRKHIDNLQLAHRQVLGKKN